MDLSPDMISSKTGSCKTWFHQRRLTIVVCFPKQLQGDISHQLQNSTWESLKTKKIQGPTAHLYTFPNHVFGKLVSYPAITMSFAGSLHKSCLHLHHPWSTVVQLHLQPLVKPPHFVVSPGFSMKSGPTMKKQTWKREFLKTKLIRCVGHSNQEDDSFWNFPDEAGVKKS